MESLTKPVVTHDQVAAIAKKHFGDLPSFIQELKEGWFNAAFRIDQPSGQSYVLKIAPPAHVRLLRYEENLLDVEVRAMRLVREKTDVPVPTILAHDRSHDEVDSDYFIMEFLSGVPFSSTRGEMSPQDQFAVHHQVGVILRQLHELTHESFGLFNGPEQRSWPEAFGLMWEYLRRDRADLEVDVPAGAFEAGGRLFPALAGVEKPTFVHWDLWDGNIFVDGAKVTGVIDFERALWGDPMLETTFLFDRPGLREGYGRIPEEEAGAEARKLLYELYLYLVMVIESKYRGFSSEHEAWPRGQIAELLPRIEAFSAGGKI